MFFSTFLSFEHIKTCFKINKTLKTKHLQKIQDIKKPFTAL